MIKSATFYRITQLPPADFSILESLESHTFAPCGPTQQISTGFIPPRGPGEALCECLNGQLIFKVATETRKVPTDIIEDAVAVRCQQIEAATGRKPGKKEKREIKEEALLDLLPKAFPSKAVNSLWIDPVKRAVVIDTSSQKTADNIVALLIAAMPDLVLALVNTQASPGPMMAEWLAQAITPETLAIDRALELEAPDETKRKVKYVNHDLDIPEVTEHLDAGMLPVSLALTWRSRVSFVLTAGMTLKKIAFLDIPESLDEHDEFDADAYLATTEINELLADLVDELGGEFEADVAL